MELLIFMMFVFSGTLLTFMVGAVVRIKWLEADGEHLRTQNSKLAREANSASKTLQTINELMRRAVLARRPNTTDDQIGNAFGEMFRIVETSELEALKKRAEMNVQQITSLPPRPSGYVYLIQDMDVTGYCKIGRSIDPKGRLRTFEVKLPFRTAVLALIESDDPTRLETELHHRYASKRVRGEWFNLSDSDIEEIKALRGEDQ